MKIEQNNPPNYDEIALYFDIEGKPVVFAYGDTLYNPSGNFIPDHLMVHEEVHSRQQGIEVKEWWDRYLIDPDFRLEQEVEAYRAQYKFLSKQTRNRELLFQFLNKFSKDLSGPIYGHMIDYETAKRLIKE